MTVGPLAEGIALRLEQEMLEVTDRPGPEEVAAITADLDRISGDVWHGEAIRTALRRWVNSVSPDGSFADELSVEARITEAPTVTWAPALILRKRTSRPLLDFYESVIGQLSDGEECPEGVVALVEIAGEAEPQDRGHAASAREPEEIYFPLPANDEQLQILKRLNRGTGVLVQGPPGTGKSHTIANLIAHLLATGQRVLVTSQTPRALRVLQEKLPNEIADLCVLLLGDDRAAMTISTAPCRPSLSATTIGTSTRICARSGRPSNVSTRRAGASNATARSCSRSVRARLMNSDLSAAPTRVL